MEEKHVFFLGGIAVGILATMVIQHHMAAKPKAVVATDTKPTK